MNLPPAVRGTFRHLLFALRLNIRSPQALIYGYLVPVFFLLAFGSVFRGESPVLYHQMGQLLTITILGGACFGLPTAIVAERERGVWRRYRLLPVRPSLLILSTVLARFAIVGSAVLLQLLLARCIYHTPLPEYPGEILIAFALTSFAFIGLGLLISALANDVPAVQAIGQCIFLPMIMVGGVGVPLAALPSWATTLSCFMPGRYAVDILQRCFTDPRGLQGSWFSACALVIIGLSTGIAGLKLFRWETDSRLTKGKLTWAAAAVLVWAAIGLASVSENRVRPIFTDASSYASLSADDIGRISFEGLAGDNELVTRLSPPFKQRELPAALTGVADALHTWPKVHLDDPVQNVFNLLSVAAAADIGADLREADVGRLIFDELQAQYGRRELTQLLAWVILKPNNGHVLTAVPGLKIRRQLSDVVVRERCVMYAKKYLGRLVGRIPD
jgi:ABC-2 type transport system permease protein